jgi:threonine/homoserine/homoserine lactone efflux protein
VIPHSAWPVDPGVILPFLVAVLLIELTPGPNMGWLALVAAGRGRTAGLSAVAGVALGLAAWMVAAAVGVSQALARAPMVYQGLRWAGVAFLLWLAWEAWRAPQDDDPTVDAADRRGLFLRGLVGNLLNPKAAVLYVALLPGFMRPDHGAAWVQALTLGGIHVAVATAVHVAIVLGADRAGRVALARTQGPVVRALMAGGIAAVALWTAWQTR